MTADTGGTAASGSPEAAVEALVGWLRDPSADADDPRWQQLVTALDRIVTRDTPDGSLGMPLPDGTPRPVIGGLYVTALARDGDPGQAFRLLAPMAFNTRGTPLMRLATAWPPIPADAVAGALQELTATGDRLVERLADTNDRLDVMADIARAALEREPDHRDLHVYAAVLLRLLGQPDEALALARRATELSDDPESTLGLAVAAHTAGRRDEACDAWRRAIEHAPDEADVRMMYGDVLLEYERPEEAREQYAAVLRRHPAHEDARAMTLWLEWQHDHNADALVRLQAMAVDAAEGSRARVLLEQATAAHRPWRDILPPLPDPLMAIVVRAVNAAMEHPRARSGEPVTAALRVDGGVAPSLLVAWQMQTSIQPMPVELNLSPGAPATPDPRLPIGSVEWQLWSFRDDGLVPAHVVPGDPLRPQIAQLAASESVIGNWMVEARPVAAALDRDRIPALLAVMAVPPPPQDPRVAAWVWLPRVQVAAATVLAAMPDGAGVPVLFDLLRGPLDWSVSAAAVVLGHLAVTGDAAMQDRVGDAFEERLRHVPSPGYCCWEPAVIQNLLALPGVTNERKAMLAARATELDRELAAIATSEIDIQPTAHTSGSGPPLDAD